MTVRPRLGRGEWDAENGTRRMGRGENGKGDISMTTQWVDVADAQAVAEESAIEVVVNGRILAIFRSGGELYALDGMCAHQGGPIASGTVEHGCVTCPWHGWQYELATGIQTINRQPLQETFAIRQRDGRIEVQLGNDSSP
ncbi:MAG: Rieske (2Fe-2S) protein [Pirellulaceae bacterium]|nr:Rieske (2Fe-2S) protein [Pirellulaceae bacterium]